nr:MAG TPA: hypothetical protein [Caudoviricetes sp.]
MKYMKGISEVIKSGSKSWYSSWLFGFRYF